MALIAFAVVARTGPVVDLMLLVASGIFLYSLLSGAPLPSRVRWVLTAFAILFCLYLSLTVARPSRAGITNTMGIIVAGLVFLYFVQNARSLVNARGTASILLICGVATYLLGQALGMVHKNTFSGISAYFVLTAGSVWVMRGVSLGKVTLIVFILLLIMGVLSGHRLMIAAALILVAVIVLTYSIPVRAVRSVLLVVVGCGIAGMIVLFSGLWGFDIKDFDSLFVEYTGRTARSGRQIIWPAILAYAAESPLVGRGTGINFSDLHESDWSAHSYFLQIYLQTGLLGVGSILLVLFAVWAAIGRPQRLHPISVFMTACFLVLLVHISFEVFLMQVNLLMGCCAWMMLGLGIGGIRSTPRAGNELGAPMVAGAGSIHPQEAH